MRLDAWTRLVVVSFYELSPSSCYWCREDQKWSLALRLQPLIGAEQQRRRLTSSVPDRRCRAILFLRLFALMISSRSLTACRCGCFIFRASSFIMCENNLKVSQRAYQVAPEMLTSPKHRSIQREMLIPNLKIIPLRCCYVLPKRGLLMSLSSAQPQTQMPLSPSPSSLSVCPLSPSPTLASTSASLQLSASYQSYSSSDPPILQIMPRTSSRVTSPRYTLILASNIASNPSWNTVSDPIVFKKRSRSIRGKIVSTMRLAAR